MAIALITGITGFTGHYVARELRDAGFDVVGIGRGSDQAGALPLVTKMYDTSIADYAGLLRVFKDINPTVVLHLAGVSSIVNDNYDNLYSVNVVGTRNLLEALVRSGCQPSVVALASSAYVYGSASAPVSREGDPLMPVNDYAVSKIAMEFVAKAWLKKLPIAVVRPFNYTGRGQSAQFLIPKIVGHFQAGKTGIELGNLEVVREYSDVRWIAKNYRLLLEAGLKSNIGGEVLNFCSGKGHSVADVLDHMRHLTGRTIEIRTGAPLIRENEILRLVGSNEKLSALIPNPPFNIESTLAWMLNERREQ